MSVVARMRCRPSCPEPDEVLIKLIAARDESAMRTLYERYNAHVFRFVARIVQDQHLAEDIASEAFFEVWRQAGTFESRSQVPTWLLAIARFKAWAANRVHRQLSIDEAKAERIQDIADNPEEALLKLNRGTILRASLALLSPEHREIIDLVYYHERTTREVAEILRVPRNTVKTRMFYARKALQRLMFNAAKRGSM
jgi:RNA polymerase sigma-70 factor, ECF subfamily